MVQAIFVKCCHLTVWAIMYIRSKLQHSSFTLFSLFKFLKKKWRIKRKKYDEREFSSVLKNLSHHQKYTHT